MCCPDAYCLLKFSVDYPKCQIVATARPYKVFADLKDFKTFEEYRVSPINWKQAAKIVHAVGHRKKLPEKTSHELLRRLEKIHGFELNPLLVTVFAATTDYSKQDLPANITELFKKFWTCPVSTDSLSFFIEVAELSEFLY